MSGEWIMASPAEPTPSGWDTDRDIDLYGLPWDSACGHLRLWLGQYSGVDGCAVTVRVDGGPDLTMRCTLADLRGWHAWMGAMLTLIDAAIKEAEAS